MKGERLSFKFENNVLGNGLYLLDFQCWVSSLSGRNDTSSLNITGDRLSLKFQNNTASENITLEDAIVYPQVYKTR